MEYHKILKISPSLYKPNYKLAQSTLKRKFPLYISPSKRAFEKYKPQGLFLEFYGKFLEVEMLHS